MATFNRFDAFVEALGRKAHDLNADTLKVMLTLQEPSQAVAVRADIAEIATGNGYDVGGEVAPGNTYKLAKGRATLWVKDVTFMASGGPMAPFRYAVLYNASSPDGDLIGYSDYGETVSLRSGETLTVEFDQQKGVLQVS